MEKLAILNYAGAMLLVRWVNVFLTSVVLGSFFFSHTSEYFKKFKFTLGCATGAWLSGFALLVGYFSLSFYSSWGIALQLSLVLMTLLWIHCIWIWRIGERTPRSESLIRANLLLTPPMLFFAQASSHLGIDVNYQSDQIVLTLTLSALVVVMEVVALWGPKLRITSSARAVGSGVFFTALLYFAVEIFTK